MIPSGKRLHNYGKSPFSIAMLVFQRVFFEKMDANYAIKTLLPSGHGFGDPPHRC
jgi:hypothetical protein